MQEVITEARQRGYSLELIKNLLKETLQYYVLAYIFSSSYSNKLIFTGGTCLRICYGLNRLSEDIDLDLIKPGGLDKNQLAKDIINYFKSDWQYQDIEVNIAGENEKIYLKFPIYTDLGLVEKISDVKKLFVKVEIEINPSKNYGIDLTPVAKYNLNFLVRSYDLPTLMSNKIAAILTRTWQKGNQKIFFKGRDYFDLLWFLQNKVTPNMPRLKDLTGIKNKEELNDVLLKKVSVLNYSSLKEDLINLFEDSKYINEITKNYQFLIKKYLKL